MAKRWESKRAMKVDLLIVGGVRDPRPRATACVVSIIAGALRAPARIVVVLGIVGSVR